MFTPGLEAAWVAIFEMALKAPSKHSLVLLSMHDASLWNS